MAKKIDENDMEMKISFSSKIHYESKNEFDTLLEQWIRMILNKYSTGIQSD
ncbi:hypothetical protein PCURB6_26470 [Paenibacillus curdlanolyticus]|nr:hypothetical protein PCURB6_26470 [Paenibacillus curdlanolyticus]